MTSQSDEAEIWWDGSVVGSGHVVGEGLGEVVAELAGTHEHLAGLVRTVLDLLGHVDEVAVGDETHRMAGRAVLLVHLVSSAHGCVIQRCEPSSVGSRKTGRAILPRDKPAAEAIL